MRLLVDGRPLLNSRGGIYRYVHQIVNAIGRAGEHEVVLSMPAHSGLPWPQQNVRESVLRIPQRGKLAESIFRHAGIPWEARRQAAQVIWEPSFAVPKRSPCPVVVSVPDVAFERFDGLMTPRRQRRLRRIVRSALARADRVIAISHATARDLKELYGLDDERLRVVHLGVSDHFRPLHDLEIRARTLQRYGLPERYILYVGTLERRKNVITLIEAFARLVSAGEPQDLVVVGRSDNDFRAISERVHQLGLEERVHFLAFVPDEDLPLVYGAAEAFAYPSLYEGFGIPVLEALACGVPTVTSNVSSLPEVAGDVAELVDPEDAEALAEALRRALQPGPEREARIARGIQHAREFTWERTAAQTVQVFEEVAQ